MHVIIRKVWTTYIKCGLKLNEWQKSSLVCSFIKPWISVFVWLTWKCLSEGGRGRRRERVCLSLEEQRALWWLILTFRVNVDRVVDNVCSQSWGIESAVSVLCEYWTCVSALLPRLSALCLQVSNLLQLHQTKSVPTSCNKSIPLCFGPTLNGAQIFAMIWAWQISTGNVFFSSMLS